MSRERNARNASIAGSLLSRGAVSAVTSRRPGARTWAVTSPLNSAWLLKRAPSKRNPEELPVLVWSHDTLRPWWVRFRWVWLWLCLYASRPSSRVRTNVLTRQSGTDDGPGTLAPTKLETANSIRSRNPVRRLFSFQCFLPQKMNVPSLLPVTTSMEPSLFRSVASTVEPTPERVSISSGSNRAPPGALGSRTVLYQ